MSDTQPPETATIQTFLTELASAAPTACGIWVAIEVEGVGIRSRCEV